MERLLVILVYTGGEQIKGKPKEKKKDKRTRINEMIRISEVRVIDDKGEQLGVMDTAEARRIAEERGFDLVEIAPNVRPPVCKIMDFGKYKYELSKKARESRKKQHVTHLKEIKIRPKIEEHDYQFKMRNAEKFLLNRDKVKFTVIFRGREMDHMEKGYEILQRIAGEFEPVASIENEAVRTGKIISMIMGPRSEKSVKKGGGDEDAKNKN
ncbi:MAG: translation initiation factor IF-3 [Candidatus Krumholzibacteriota bacterium]|nr:translation initiation factor IF-3 [Candidatus Krumholzibacteriota bacterium]